ncbi:hypothetical protein GUITHDRAFT_154137 [Guillardia theta CCMP2712]|uniref:Uncharacterized protein n=3 Tax=Guillardia theta TaxID=55529 RepID=L1IX58_GUITC|nr:hypothetical protein GUITHDRAFT_154137 [Guillardia theta CCMP2712]EKX40469.1 hypothetical protein GUITHDRAFT_154137 [Guillardia theta CCMP2712]|eukprot:XP_005827449.1 hypothetical protein GUITHDRAFT_154137 [Guillardia theta CCMP2712]
MGCMLELDCGYVGGMVAVIALMMMTCLALFYIERRMRRRYPGAPYGFEPTDLLSEQERYHLRRFKVLRMSSSADKVNATQMIHGTAGEHTTDRTTEVKHLFEIAVGATIEVINTRSWGWQGSLNHQNAWFHFLSKEKSLIQTGDAVTVKELMHESMSWKGLCRGVEAIYSLPLRDDSKWMMNERNINISEIALAT